MSLATLPLTLFLFFAQPNSSLNVNDTSNTVHIEEQDYSNYVQIDTLDVTYTNLHLQEQLKYVDITKNLEKRIGRRGLSFPLLVLSDSVYSGSEISGLDMSCGWMISMAGNLSVKNRSISDCYTLFLTMDDEEIRSRTAYNKPYMIAWEKFLEGYLVYPGNYSEFYGGIASSSDSANFIPINLIATKVGYAEYFSDKDSTFVYGGANTIQFYGEIGNKISLTLNLFSNNIRLSSSTSSESKDVFISGCYVPNSYTATLERK